MAKPCEHIQGFPADEIAAEGCETCLEIGGRWVHLRMCLGCGRIGCCDDSPNRHARAHATEAGHPAVRSVEPGEFWAWCYEHNLGAMLPTT